MTKTVVASRYGGPEVLELHDMVLPRPRAGQVLIDVAAAGTNPIDCKLYSGELGTDPAALPVPVGLEVSGVVAALGPGTIGLTSPLHPGEAVMAAGVSGGYAEQLITNAAHAGHKPANLPFEQAAGLLVAGSTAWHLLTATKVDAGDTVLIHGAAGGVGASQAITWNREPLGRGCLHRDAWNPGAAVPVRRARRSALSRSAAPNTPAE